MSQQASRINASWIIVFVVVKPSDIMFTWWTVDFSFLFSPMQKPNSDHLTTGSVLLPVRATWSNRFSTSFHSTPLWPTKPLMNPTPWVASFSIIWEQVCSELKFVALRSPSCRTFEPVGTEDKEWRTWVQEVEEEVVVEEDKEEEEGDDLKRAMRDRSWGILDFTSPSIDGLWRELKVWLICHGKWRFCFHHIVKKMWIEYVMHNSGINKKSFRERWWVVFLRSTE